jgi:acyl-CoA dehydrogenase
MMDVATLWRPIDRVLRIDPLNNESVLTFVSERVLGLSRSY